MVGNIMFIMQTNVHYMVVIGSYLWYIRTTGIGTLGSYAEMILPPQPASSRMQVIPKTYF